jgi:hypothetical protein
MRRKSGNIARNYKLGCCEKGWELIMAGGRFNTECKSRYSPIEGELLGIACALHKSRYLTHGSQNLTVLTDHKALVGFLNFEAINEIENRRLINLKRKTDQHTFDIQFVEGINNLSDGISRITSWRKTAKEDTVGIRGDKLAWSKVTANMTDIIDENWELMSGSAKVNVLLQCRYETDSTWEEDLVESKMNTQMCTNRSVAVRLLELEEDLQFKPTFANNWTRIDGV